MSVVQLTRFTVDASQAARARALIDQMRRVYESSGAEYHSLPPYRGASPRQVVARACFPDWESFGRAMQELRASRELARVRREMRASGALTPDGRAVLEAADE